jgi:hypothetical protein
MNHRPAGERWRALPHAFSLVFIALAGELDDVEQAANLPQDPLLGKFVGQTVHYEEGLRQRSRRTVRQES